MTAAERLIQLAGTTGTAATLLLLIGSGATAGDALTNYSGLPSATAAEHLLANAVQPATTFVLGMRRPRLARENDEALLFSLGLI